MHKLRIGLVLSASVWAISAMPTSAAAPPALRESVAVCDPNSPQHCAAPDSAGALPISGSITATNASIGVNNATAPTSSTEIGSVDGTGKLQAASSTNPLPVTLANTGANATAVKVDGSAVTQPVSGSVTANIGTSGSLALDTSVVALQVSQGSTTASQKGALNLGAVTTAAPTYTTGQSSPLSLTTGGALRVSGTVTAANDSVGVTGAAVPGSITYLGGNNGGNAIGITLNSSGQPTIANTSFAATQATAASLNATVVGTGTFATQATLQTQTDTVMVGGVNVKEINAVTPLMGNGVTGTGSQRVTIASDNTAFSVNANAGTNLNTSALALETGGNLATIAGSITSSVQQHNVKQVNGVTTLAGAGAVGTGAQRVAVGQDMTTIAGSAPGTAGTASSNVVTVQGVASMTKLLVTPDSVALPANQSVNVSQINAVTPLMGNGITGTGSQRVTIASDNTAFSVNSTLQTQTDTIMVGGTNTKEINGVTPLMGNGTTGTGSQRVTIASDNTAFSVNGTLQTQTDTVMVGGVNVKEINAVTPLMGNGVTGTGSLRVTLASDTTTNTNPFYVQGGAANNATTGGNPLQQSCLAVSAEPTLATNGQNASCTEDLAHKQVVIPYAVKENFVSGTTAAMTGTTSTSLIGIPGSGLYNYITQIACVNSHATVGTFVTVQDGSGGTALMTLAAASVFGGSSYTFPTPLKQPTSNTALYVANVTTGANVICSATGYKGS